MHCRTKVYNSYNKHYSVYTTLQQSMIRNYFSTTWRGCELPPSERVRNY